MGYEVTNVVIVQQGEDCFCKELLRVPGGVSLAKGDVVIYRNCGENDESRAVCACGSRYVTDKDLEMLMAAVGATLPLSSVVGRIVEIRYDEEILKEDDKND